MRLSKEGLIESGDGKLFEENKNGEEGKEIGQRVFGVVLKGYPQDFQMWLESAKTYGLYIIFSKSSRIGKLVIKEEAW